MVSELINYWGNWPPRGAINAPTTAAGVVTMLQHWISVWQADTLVGSNQHGFNANQNRIMDSWVAFTLGTGHAKRKLGHQLVSFRTQPFQVQVRG